MRDPKVCSTRITQDIRQMVANQELPVAAQS
jgi:hypothetical protein